MLSIKRVVSIETLLFNFSYLFSGFINLFLVSSYICISFAVSWLTVTTQFQTFTQPEMYIYIYTTLYRPPNRKKASEAVVFKLEGKKLH